MRAALLAEHIELNMSNYGPDDVDRLNAWAIEAYDFIARAASAHDSGQNEREAIYQILTEEGAWLDATREYYERVKSDPALARVVYAASTQARAAAPQAGLTDQQREQVSSYAAHIERTDPTTNGQEVAAAIRALLAQQSAAPMATSHRLNDETVARLKHLLRRLDLENAVPTEILNDPEALFSIFGQMRSRLDRLTALPRASEQAAGAVTDPKIHLAMIEATKRSKCPYPNWAWCKAFAKLITRTKEQPQ